MDNSQAIVVIRR